MLKHADAAKSKEDLPPEDIAKDSENNQLGRSSRHLKVTDFELMRTLGTGKTPPGWRLEPLRHGR